MLQHWTTESETEGPVLRLGYKVKKAELKNTINKRK